MDRPYSAHGRGMRAMPRRRRRCEGCFTSPGALPRETDVADDETLRQRVESQLSATNTFPKAS